MSNGKKRARRDIDTVKTKNKKGMVRDAKTGKEMPFRQFMELRTKQEIDEDRKKFPFSPVSTQTYKRMKRAKPRIEDKSVFDYQTKGKPVKKVVGKIKRAMGMSGLKEGGVVGGQKKLDMNKDGKLTKVDFQMLGNKSKPFKGKIDTDKEKLVSENGKTMVVKKAKGGSIQVSGSNFSGIY